MSDEKSPIIKVATNEYMLLALRVGMNVGVGLVGYMVADGFHDIKASIIDVKHDITDMRRQYADDRVASAIQLGKIEGQVGELKGTVEVHRSRLTEADIDRRSLWQRVFELSRGQQQPPRAVP